MNHKPVDPSSDVLYLEKAITRLNKNVQRQTSLTHNFALGLVRGLGTAVGATVVFGLVVAFVMQVIKSIDYVPIVNNIVNSQVIEELISKFTR